MGKFYITTPIYYVNASPHIGHAYTEVIVDALARFNRMLGKEVFFLTGTDEHGEKIEEASIKAGFKKGEEKKFVDTIVVNFKKAWDALNIRYDYFIRTTDEIHKVEVRKFLEEMKKNGDIYQGEYDGYFCTPCETFWTDKEAEGGICPECKRQVARIKEKNYFFRMKKYQEWLVSYINNTPGFIMPDYRKNEVLGFLREELEDLCISRPKERMAWGIELPFDRDFVVYVWFDALINYISALKAHAGDKGNEFWPADFHVMAKDILRHHAVYWPIMLKSLGYSLPKTIFAHGWWKIKEEKISKSKGNIVEPIALAEKYGIDSVRYFLLKAVSLGLDGSFSESALILMYNSGLANDLGNLLNRTLTMVEKYFAGKTPFVEENPKDAAQIKRSSLIRDVVCGIFPEVRDCMLSPKLLLKEALDKIMAMAGKANKYIEESTPWKYAKENDTETIKLIIADLLEVLRSSAVLLYPFMPYTAQGIWDQLGLKGRVEEGADKKELNERKDPNNWRKFPAGINIAKGEPLFPRI